VAETEALGAANLRAIVSDELDALLPEPLLRMVRNWRSVPPGVGSSRGRDAMNVTSPDGAGAGRRNNRRSRDGALGVQAGAGAGDPGGLPLIWASKPRIWVEGQPSRPELRA
jgi:hypothetical protein